MFGALDAAWAKYNRAARDLRVLHENVTRFLAREPYSLDVHFDRESGWHVVRMRIREEPPPVLGVVVGSIAHQAYSALNHVTWELAVRNLGYDQASEPRVRSRFDFPICEKRRDFRKRDVLTHVGDQAARVLEQLQPFHSEPGPHGKIQHPLLLMKELADADKHRVLAAAYGAIDLANAAIHWGDAGGATYEDLLPDDERTLADGMPLGRFRFAEGNATASIRVEHPDPDLVFESDTWAGLSIFSIGDCLATADRCISVLSELFP
jgi:hypothetical protein